MKLLLFHTQNPLLYETDFCILYVCVWNSSTSKFSLLSTTKIIVINKISRIWSTKECFRSVTPLINENRTFQNQSFISYFLFDIFFILQREEWLLWGTKTIHLFYLFFTTSIFLCLLLGFFIFFFCCFSLRRLLFTLHLNPKQTQSLKDQEKINV